MGLRMSANGLRLERGVAEDARRLRLWTLGERLERPVHVHPDSGRKALCIAPLGLDHVVGMEEDIEGSRSLIERLLSHGIREERTYRHRWQEGDLVVWDNRALMHSTTPYTYAEHRRSLWQIVLRHGD
mmetsp:Transcript_1841/g.2150  ORF Transcript_1841/g.2150 Transcript_1841/m.2150 type:complete len:128 (+) Transcript_1841:2-385(+)